jgi:hypothetical protein
MNPTDKDILSQIPISDELINKSLKHQLSEEDQQMMDEALLSSDFLKEGMDGLREYSSLEKANRQATDLNAYLLQQLKQKNTSKKELGIKHSKTTILLVIGILLLIVLVFYILFVIPHKI